MQWVGNGSRLGYPVMNAVSREWVMPVLPCDECSGYGMGQSYPVMNAVGTECVTPGIGRKTRTFANTVC